MTTSFTQSGGLSGSPGALAVTDTLFFARPGATLSRDEAETLTRKALAGMMMANCFLNTARANP